MTKIEDTRSSSRILARDIEGAEHRLVVVAHCDLVAIEDGTITRILHPAAAIELALALIMATKGQGSFRGIVGPVSGKF